MPDGTQDRAPAVLSADAVDADRLAAEDPEDAPRRLDSYGDVVSACLGRHGGRGSVSRDGAVAAFDDPVSAVACACEIQEDLASRNAVLHRGRRLAWRIGVALAGEGGEALAAGLRDAAGPGEICLSGAVQRATVHRPDLAAAFDGERYVPGAADPVAVYRLRPAPAGPAPAAPGDGLRSSRAARNADRAYRLLSASVFAMLAAVAGAAVFVASGETVPEEGLAWDLVPTVFGLLSTLAAAAAVVFAYAGRTLSAGGTWVDGHFRFLIRTFWIALGAQLVGILAAAVAIGLLVLAALPVWVVLRCRRGRALLRRGAPHPQPDTWGFG